MNIILAKKEIFKNAVQALNRQTGLVIGKTERFNPKDYLVDYKTALILPTNGEKKMLNYWAQVTKNVTNAKLGDAALQAKQTPERFVLVAEYISATQAEKLRELDVSFFDAAGNAYFNEPGLYIFVTGKKTTVRQEKPLELFSPAGIKLLLAFLSEPKLETEDYRTIAETTGVGRATIGDLMANFEKAGYLMRRNSRERLLVRKPELIKRWVENYSERFRPKLKPVRFRSRKYEGRWWDAVNIADYNAVWGGETGGARLTHHLKPATATIYSVSRLPRLQAQYALVRDERGNIEILEKFWTTGEVGDVAPPLIVYADLVATANERNLETAQIIYDRYLAKLAETATRIKTLKSCG